jgi:hypothetical protein
MNARQLALIAEFVALCQEASIQCWLRGGWAMDFFLGRVTREHEDIDLFVWAKDAGTLARELEQAGFREVEGPPPEAQRDFVKAGEALQTGWPFAQFPQSSWPAWWNSLSAWSWYLLASAF